MEILDPAAGSSLGRMRALAAVCLCASALLASASVRAAGEYSEDAVKAAYLYRMAGYVEWPEQGRDKRAFIIAVLGAPAVARALKRLVPGHLIEDRPVEVRELAAVREVGTPQVLFVGSNYINQAHGLMSALASKPTLMVTDSEQGLSEGSEVNFLTIDRRVRFEVSLTAAERAHLKISSELLTVAVRVHGGRRQTRDGCVPLALADTDPWCAPREARTLARGDGWYSLTAQVM